MLINGGSKQVYAVMDIQHLRKNNCSCRNVYTSTTTMPMVTKLCRVVTF